MITNPYDESLFGMLRELHKGRSYHNFDWHVIPMAKMAAIILEEEDGCYDRNRNILKMACLFHDVCYDFGGKDNEERSANVAENFLRVADERIVTDGVNLNEPFIDAVFNTIMLTKEHKMPSDVDKYLGGVYKAIIDADLSMFTHRVRYDEHVARIRKEYGRYSDEMFIDGRLVFLLRKTIGDGSRLYYSRYAEQHKWEEIARKNIAREIEVLESGDYLGRGIQI